MSSAYVFVKDNKAEIALPPGSKVQVKAKTNSKLEQKIILKDKSETYDFLYSGSGESNTSIGNDTITVPEKNLFNATFEFSDNGVFKPSKLNSGGPYSIGNYNLMVIVAENGDDADYNDSILEFSWYTPK